MKIHAVVAELSHADGQPERHTDRRDEANVVAICNLVNFQEYRWTV